MEQIRRQLADGVELAVNRTEQFKTGLFSVTLTAPLRRETATAYALIADVLYRGSEKYPNMERISAATDELYGASLGPAVRQKGESQCIGFACSFIDDRYALDGTAVLEAAVELTGELLLHPLTTEQGVFHQEYVESEGANLADQINARMNDKRGWSIFRLIQEMCRGEAYALDKLGEVQEAKSMTAEKLWRCYQRLLRESRVTFYYGGSADPKRVEQAIQSVFAPLMTARSALSDCLVVDRPGHPVQRVREQMDVTQGKLAMGFRTGGITMASREYPALLVCNAMFGGTSHSKLFVNVREKMSLCYFASSMLDKRKGVMVVSSGVECSDFERAEQAILEQLDAVRQGDFTQAERVAAIRAVTNGLRGRKDSQGQLEDDALTQILAGEALGGTDDLIRAVEQVTAEDVSMAAQRLSLDTVYYLTGEED